MSSRWAAFLEIRLLWIQSRRFLSGLRILISLLILSFLLAMPLRVSTKKCLFPIPHWLPCTNSWNSYQLPIYFSVSHLSSVPFPATLPHFLNSLEGYKFAISLLFSAATVLSLSTTSSSKPSSHSNSRGATCCNWWNAGVVNGWAKGSGKENRSWDWQEKGSWMIFKQLTTVLFITEKNWLQSDHLLLLPAQNPRRNKTAYLHRVSYS